MILQWKPLRVYGHFVLLLAVGCALHFATAENETEVLDIESNPIQDVTPLQTLRKNNPQITIYE